MTHLWWRAITENDRFRPTYRGRRPIVRHAGRAPAENPCPNLLRRNGPPDPLGNVKAAAISDKFRETTGSFRSAPLTRLSGGAPSHQPTSFVRSDMYVRSHEQCRSLTKAVGVSRKLSEGLTKVSESHKVCRTSSAVAPSWATAVTLIRQTTARVKREYMYMSRG